MNDKNMIVKEITTQRAACLYPYQCIPSPVESEMWRTWAHTPEMYFLQRLWKFFA